MAALRNPFAFSVFRHPTPFLTRRGVVQFSVYDKNVDEQVCPAIVPDDVINQQSSKYWAPHPQTGVFGPNPSGTVPSPASVAAGSEASVLEQKAWFRPLEDLEKPQPTS